MATGAEIEARPREVMNRLRSILVSYLADRGELERRGYVRLPDPSELPPLQTSEQWKDAMDDFSARIRREETALATARNAQERLAIVVCALSAAILKIRSDLAWTEEYREAGLTADEEDFARTAPARLRDAS